MDEPNLIHSAIATIYDAALSPSSWPSALDAIAQCFDDIGALLLYSRDDGNFGYIESIGLTGLIPRFFELYNGEDLRAVRGIERGVFLTHEAVTDRHIVTDEEVETHPFYLALNKMGLKYFATVPICPDWRMNAGVAVQRQVGRAPYSEDELELLTILGRHVERAFRLGAKLLDSEMSSIGLGNALNKLGMGIFVLDGLCRVTFANSAAERLLGDTHTMADDRLILPPALRTEFRKVIEAGSGTVQPYETVPVIIRRNSGPSFVSYVLPMPQRLSAAEAFLGQARAIILVRDLKPGSHSPDPALVRDVLGLTLGEARLASLVGTGIAIGDAAGNLNITEQTARVVLKRVFSKLEVSRQSELAALMGRLMLC